MNGVWKMCIIWLALRYLTWKDGGGGGVMIGRTKQMNTFSKFLAFNHKITNLSHLCKNPFNKLWNIQQVYLGRALYCNRVCIETDRVQPTDRNVVNGHRFIDRRWVGLNISTTMFLIPDNVIFYMSIQSTLTQDVALDTDTELIYSRPGSVHYRVSMPNNASW